MQYTEKHVKHGEVLECWSVGVFQLSPIGVGTVLRLEIDEWLMA